MRDILEKMTMFMVMTLIYVLFSDEVSVFIVLTAFIILFLPEVLNIKYLLEIITVLLIVLVFINAEWIYYFPLLTLFVHNKYGKWAYMLLLIFVIYEEWLLLVFSLAGFYLSALNLRITSLESDNRKIRDRLTRDNMQLKKKHNELMKSHEKEVFSASLNERNRIARDMHDALGHSLSSSILLIESLQYVDDEKKIKTSLKTLQKRLKSGMDDIRNSIHHLYDTSIDFRSRVESYVDNMRSDYDIDFQYNVDMPMSHELKLDLLSIVMESLTNIRKHSDATAVSIIVREHPEYIIIVIKDNGSHNKKSEHGMGLQSMKETVRKYNGVFNTMDDDGFKVHVFLYKEEI